MRRSMYALLIAGAAVSVPLLLAGRADAAPRTPSEPRLPATAQRAEPAADPVMRSGLLSLGGGGVTTPQARDVGRDAHPHDRAVSSADPSEPTVPRDASPAGSSTSGGVANRIAAAWPGDGSKAVRVASCESSLNPNATSRSGRYSGLFQFDRQTWRSVGGSGSPAQASVEEQTRRAWRLKQSRGWAPWPACGRR